MFSKRWSFLVATLCLAWAGWSQPQPAAPAAPFNLRCEYLVAPMGVDVAQPRLSWALDHPERGQAQSAYQVLVSLQPGAPDGDQWDSGRVASAQSTHVAYGGRPLASGRTYYWRARWWDNRGAASPWSAVTQFDTGLLAASDWKGQFIGGANQLRKEFTLARAPARARVYIAGLGYYELRVNGRKAGRSVLDPAWTTYEKRVLYTTIREFLCGLRRFCGAGAPARAPAPSPVPGPLSVSFFAACDDSVGRAPPPAHRPPGRCLAHLGVGLRLRAATPPVWLRLC
ncbi:MAG: hypothetical protein FJW34_22325, partial [Acidobacteria bacterium]|nr:hypothetical protein [Acidobacteriota bacterium]